MNADAYIILHADFYILLAARYLKNPDFYCKTYLREQEWHLQSVLILKGEYYKYTL